jgi:hypothetical protein
MMPTINCSNIAPGDLKHYENIKYAPQPALQLIVVESSGSRQRLPQNRLWRILVSRTHRN